MKHVTGLLAIAVFGLSTLPAALQAQLVPGTGYKIHEVGDDFEDPSFEYYPQLPKASSNIDKYDRQPAGFSNNRRWYESTYRGTPDFVKRVPTPEGGLPGSTGAMALQTLNSGIPGRFSYEFQQDDLIANLAQTIGYLPVQTSPSVVVRVYLPEFSQWEQRTGSHFGIRADCQTIIDKPSAGRGRFFRNVGVSRQVENYWPGFFIQFNRKANGFEQDHAILLMRSGSRGEDIPGPAIVEPGWVTLGMSFTPDGQVHYYARKGVEDLRPQDRLLSSFPYGYKAQQVNTFFFNVVNQDDGRTWSTRFIVDDVSVYSSTPRSAPAPAAQQAASATPQNPPPPVPAAPEQPTE